MKSLTRMTVAALMAAMLVVGSAATQPGDIALADPGPAGWVEPINWSDFTATPTDSDSLRIREILRNGNRYTLTTWWTSQGYGSQSGDYLSPLGAGGVTAASYHGFSLAVSLSTGAYDATHTGVSTSEARNRALKLTRTVALRHKANTSGGWGDGWQDPSFAAYAGWAGWLLWDHLNDTDQDNIQRMVLYQADKLINEPIEYYRDKSGQIIRPGNTAADENSWRGLILQLATSMMPEHPSWNLWMNKGLAFMLSVNATPADANDPNTMINGRVLSKWLNGSNLESNGTLINHNRIHPDYMISFRLNFMAVAGLTLSGQPTPEAVFHNGKLVYQALVDLQFNSPPHQSPGGTIYVDDSDAIYYPQGTDWSPTRRMIFAETDVAVRAFGLDSRVSQDAAYWEDLHAAAALAQQQRHSDGKMYAPGEHTSEGLDNAVVPARAWMTKWITAQDDVVFTNQAFPQGSIIDDTDPRADYSGGWTAYSEPDHVGQTLESGRTGTPSVTISFVGTRAQYVGLSSQYNGYGDVYVDGVYQSTIDFYSPTSLPQQVLYDTGGLLRGRHTITVQRSSQGHPQALNDYINFDALLVDQVPADTYVVDASDPRADYTGGWTGYIDPDYLQGYLVSGRTGSPLAMITFVGSRAQYVGLTSQSNGYGDVYVDGAYQATIDFYSQTPQPQQVLYDTGTLSRGVHTISVERSPQPHPQALNDYINFDALLVESDAYLMDDTDPRAGYTGTWIEVSGDDYLAQSLGSGRSQSSSLTVTFVGSRAQYIGLKSSFNGYGDVYVDGVFQTTIDFYSPSAQYQQVLYDTGPLTHGVHSINVRRSPQSHPQAVEDFINFDALLVDIDQ